MSKIPTAVSNIVSNISSHYQSSSIPKPSVQPPQFFEHAKKGEVNELKQYLSFLSNTNYFLEIFKTSQKHPERKGPKQAPGRR